MFPDVCCPQGRLMKLTWHDRVTGSEMLAKRPHEACGYQVTVVVTVIVAS
jgi:hypothetical protein